MNLIAYKIKKIFYKYLEEKIHKRKIKKELILKQKYCTENFNNKKLKVFIYQENFNQEYTRFFTSSSNFNYCFTLVDNVENAAVIVFINKIDSQIWNSSKNTILFFHEPLAYAHLYQSVIDENDYEKSNFLAVSHLPEPSKFINTNVDIDFLRSIPYVHFHHMASFEELNRIDIRFRTKDICCITSGFSGIPGYEKRRFFIEALTKQCSVFDLYGRFNKISYSIPSYISPCDEKWKLLNTYKYTLVIENSDDDYYISEKIFDALICGSMPIYYGSKKIYDILPKEWFYYLPNLDAIDVDNLMAFIKTDAYKNISENRSEISNYIYEKFSFYQALDCLLKNKNLPIKI